MICFSLSVCITKKIMKVRLMFSFLCGPSKDPGCCRGSFSFQIPGKGSWDSRVQNRWKLWLFQSLYIKEAWSQLGSKIIFFFDLNVFNASVRHIFFCDQKRWSSPELENYVWKSVVIFCGFLSITLFAMVFF